MSSAPRVVFGLPAYDRPDTLARTIESLLSQTFPSFALVITDDAPSAQIEEIVERYVHVRPHLTYEANPRRLGMIGNWQRVFERARELYPSSEYFAWASDHDVWHARWLEELVAVLDHHPDAVLAYPLHLQLTTGGARLSAKEKVFDTAGMADRGARLRHAARHMRSGDMIYGLMRAEALEAAGVFRRVITPDRQVLLVLSLYGQFHQVPEVLWYRELRQKFNMARQRRAFFPDGVPLYAYVPPHLQHCVTLLWDFAIRGKGLSAFGRIAGLRYAISQLWSSVARDLVRPKMGWRLAAASIIRRRWVSAGQPLDETK